jgi:hypothetical protein
MSIEAPIALQALMVDMMSSDISALSILERPSAMDASMNALWLWLLDGGGVIVPDILPPWKDMEVIVRTSYGL